MGKYKRLAALLAVLIAACGGGSDDRASCSPAASITSTPPTSVSVGQLYQYQVQFTLACIPLVSCGFDLVQGPPGAGVDRTGSVFWTPGAADANRAVAFAIATSSDLCGHRATQSWTVIVSP